MAGLGNFWEGGERPARGGKGGQVRRGIEGGETNVIASGCILASASAKQMAKRELKWNIEQAEKEGNGARSVPQNVPEARCQKVKPAWYCDQGMRVR